MYAKKVNFPRRAAVGYHAIMDEGEEDPSFTKDTTKSSEERAMTMEAMRACLGSISDLNEAELESAVDKAWRMETKPGQRIIEQGNIIASRFYIIVRGHFMVTIDKEDGGAGGGVSEDKMMAGAANFRNSVHMNSDKSGGPRFQAMLDKGQYFGELALLHRAPRAANVHCHSEDGGCLFVVDRVTFQAILGDRARAITEQYKALVRQCKHDNGQYIFLNLTDEECVEAANIMVDRQFDKGDFICRQGESGHEFYIVREGTLNVKRIDPSNGHVAFEKTLKAGDCFGERALLDDDDKRKATVVVTSNFASILTIDRQTFENFLAPLSELKKPADDFQKQAGKRKSRTRKSTIGAGAIIANTMPTMKPSISPLRPDAFKIKGSLGTGAFGSVTLRTHLNTKQDFAIKQLSKAHIVKHKLVEKVKSEKGILKLTASPFIVQLFGTYRDADSIYFVLEAAMGGELYATYNRKGHFGKEPMARFFAACVTMAFVHLHERKIAYRDLKPENVLITKRGYGKVTDMGLATLVLGRTFTLCGTPEYFAPEIITAAGHNWNVD
jgi:CRP-like cAMP-binding protein